MDIEELRICMDTLLGGEELPDIITEDNLADDILGLFL